MDTTMGIDLLVRGSGANKTPSHLPLSQWEVSHDERPCSSRQSSGNPVRDDTRRVSFLKVPESPARRPSTADLVIEKLQVERVEGGGLAISGITLASNCHFTLLIFGTLFLLAGIVLSYVGFASKKATAAVAQAVGAPKGTFQKANTHKQMQVIGPIFLALSLLMVILGLLMYALNKKVRHNEKARRATISAMQLSQLENNFSRAQVISNGSPLHTAIPLGYEAHPILSLRKGSLWMDPTPIEDPDISREVTPAHPIRSPSPHIESGGGNWGSNGQYDVQTSMQFDPQLSMNLQYCTTKDGITTYPDCYSVASFPISFDPTGESTSRRLSSTFSNPVQLFEVQECGRDKSDMSASHAHSSSPMPGQSIDNHLAVDNQQLNGDYEDGASKGVFHIPQIQVTPTEATTSMSGSLALVTASLPLSKNGVALPRLSRHSMSS